jgi:uncharacterized protein YegL
MGRKSRRGESDTDLFPERPAAEAGVNREPRVTGSFNIDVTASLSQAISAYVEALHAMYAACRAHPATRSAAFVSTTLCGGSRHAPAPYLPFAAAELPTIELVGGSPGGRWLRTGVEHLRAEHARMTADGVPSNKDVFLMISDFHWDDPQEFDAAVEAYRTLESERPQFNGFMVMAGPNPNADLAARISKKRPPVHLNDLKVDELFRWVSVVMQRASMSRPGQSVDLPEPAWTLSDGTRR